MAHGRGLRARMQGTGGDQGRGGSEGNMNGMKSLNYSLASMKTKPAQFHWFNHGGSKRRSSLTPAVMCVAAFMLSSFVWHFFTLGDAGLIIGSAVVTNATNFPPFASFFYTNFACSE